MKKILTIQSKLDNISQIEKLVDEVSDQFKLSSDLYGKLLIATIEAVNNSIVHGNKLDETKKVDISVFVNDNQIVITIIDEGKGFDFNNVPDPTTPENIENVSGRGVFLMKKLADEIKFNNSGSSVELLFKK